MQFILTSAVRMPSKPEDFAWLGTEMRGTRAYAHSAYGGYAHTRMRSALHGAIDETKWNRDRYLTQACEWDDSEIYTCYNYRFLEWHRLIASTCRSRFELWCQTLSS